MLHSNWLRPVVLGILLVCGMRRTVAGAGTDNLAILDNTTDIHDGRPIGWWGGEGHHDGGVVVALEVDEIPLASGMMRLHALDSMDEQSLAGEVDRSILRHDAASHIIPRPESMAHVSPWVLEVGAVQGLAVGTNNEARSGLVDGDVNDRLLVGHGLDSVCVALSVELHGAVIGVEVCPVLGEVDVRKGVGAPEEWFLLVRVEDLGVKLSCNLDAARV